MLDALRSKKFFITVVAAAALILLLIAVSSSSEKKNNAPIARSKASAVVGAAPLQVQFTGEQSSDADGDALTFTWEFGDGTKSAKANPAKTFEKSGQYSVVLKVSDGVETVAAAPIVITVGEAEVQGAATEESNTSATNKKQQVLAAATTTQSQNAQQTTPSAPAVPTTPTIVPNPNLIPNPSFVDPYSNDTPLHWVKGSYGVNVVDFVYEATGRTDNASVSITMSGNVFGDAKWIFEPVAIEGGKTYEFKDWYKSDVQTEILVDYTLDDNSHQYELVGTVAPAADWTEQSQVLVTPDNATEISIHHVIKTDGSLQLDDYSLVEQ